MQRYVHHFMCVYIYTLHMYTQMCVYRYVDIKQVRRIERSRPPTSEHTHTTHTSLMEENVLTGATSTWVHSLCQTDGENGGPPRGALGDFPCRASEVYVRSFDCGPEKVKQ